MTIYAISSRNGYYNHNARSRIDVRSLCFFCPCIFYQQKHIHWKLIPVGIRRVSPSCTPGRPGGLRVWLHGLGGGLVVLSSRGLRDNWYNLHIDLHPTSKDERAPTLDVGYLPPGFGLAVLAYLCLHSATPCCRGTHLLWWITSRGLSLRLTTSPEKKLLQKIDVWRDNPLRTIHLTAGIHEVQLNCFQNINVIFSIIMLICWLEIV